MFVMSLKSNIYSLLLPVNLTSFYKYNSLYFIRTAEKCNKTKPFLIHMCLIWTITILVHWYIVRTDSYQSPRPYFTKHLLVDDCKFFWPDYWQVLTTASWVSINRKKGNRIKSYSISQATQEGKSRGALNVRNFFIMLYRVRNFLTSKHRNFLQLLYLEI